MKSVVVIPLTEVRARDALKALAVRNSTDPRMSLVATSAMAQPMSLDDVPGGSDAKEPGAPRVTFAEEEQVKIMTPKAQQSFEHSDEESAPNTGASSPADSVVSTPSSEFSVMTGNIAKTLADRLSFWNKMSKRPTPSRAASVDQALKEGSDASPQSSRRGSLEDRTSIDAMMKNGDKEPAEVLERIIDAQSAAPTTPEQKNSELEEKIIKEVVQQFSRGGMYFAYRFGMYMCEGCAAHIETSKFQISQGPCSISRS